MIKYIHKKSNKPYRVTRKMKDGVYLISDSFGFYYPKGCSFYITNNELKEKYDSNTK